jgi:predicted component of type VI protein secretion system
MDKMTPEQALVLLENLKREAPEKLVAAGNTFALEAARWAQQAIIRDRKIYAEVQEIKKILMALAKMTPDTAAEAPEAVEAEEPAVAAHTNGAHTNGAHAGVDPETLKGEELEAYMDAVLKNEPPNASAPSAPKPFGAPAATPENNEPLVAAEEAPVARPEGVVVVPAAAAKAKARAAQAPGNAAPKA